MGFLDKLFGRGKETASKDGDAAGDAASTSAGVAGDGAGTARRQPVWWGR